MATVFERDDTGYLAWLQDHPNGYVLNTNPRGKANRRFNPDYMVLHRAQCRTICNLISTAREGGFTGRNYVKICSESIPDLREWVRQHGRPDGSFSNECSHCNPS